MNTTGKLQMLVEAEEDIVRINEYVNAARVVIVCREIHGSNQTTAIFVKIPMSDFAGVEDSHRLNRVGRFRHVRNLCVVRMADEQNALPLNLG